MIVIIRCEQISNYDDLNLLLKNYDQLVSKENEKIEPLDQNTNKADDQLEEQKKNQYSIALDRNYITRDKIDIMKKFAKFVLEQKESDTRGLNIAIDEDISKRSSNSIVNYTYTEEETELLLELHSYLKSLGHSGLVVYEFTTINDVNDFSKGWNMDQIVDANNKIQELADIIKDKKFSPFEAMLFIHKCSTDFIYFEPNNVSVSNVEVGRVLPSILNGKYIVCTGYASFVKAVVDRAEIPGLQCDIVACKIINGGYHCHNLIHIKDEKYSINGSYIEDACWDCKKPENNESRTGGGFAHCLYHIKDLLYLSRWRYADYGLNNNRREVFAVNKTSTEDKLNIILNCLCSKHIIFPNIVNEYIKKSRPISIETYKQGLKNMYMKFSHLSSEKINKSIEKEIYISEIAAVKSFTNKAINCFRKKVKKMRWILI